MTHAPSTYKIPSVSNIPAAMNVALYDNQNVEPTVFRSKAVGEPPLLLGFSVLLAIRAAVASVAPDSGDAPALRAPATPESILNRLTHRHRKRSPQQRRTSLSLRRSTNEPRSLFDASLAARSATPSRTRRRHRAGDDRARERLGAREARHEDDRHTRRRTPRHWGRPSRMEGYRNGAAGPERRCTQSANAPARAFRAWPEPRPVLRRRGRAGVRTAGYKRSWLGHVVEQTHGAETIHRTQRRLWPDSGRSGYL